MLKHLWNAHCWLKKVVYIINSDNGILLDNDDIFDVSNALKAVYCNRSTYDYKIIADNASKNLL